MTIEEFIQLMQQCAFCEMCPTFKGNPCSVDVFNIVVELENVGLIIGIDNRFNQMVTSGLRHIASQLYSEVAIEEQRLRLEEKWVQCKFPAGASSCGYYANHQLYCGFSWCTDFQIEMRINPLS